MRNVAPAEERDGSFTLALAKRMNISDEIYLASFLDRFEED